MRSTHFLWWLAWLLPGVLQAQSAEVLAQERQAFARWLTTAPTSPLRAVAHQRIGDGLTLGTGASGIVLEGVPSAQVTVRRGRAMLVASDGERALPRGRPLPYGDFRLMTGGMAGRTTLTVFGGTARRRTPSWFDYSAGAVDTVSLTPGTGERVVLLAPDGSDVAAAEAGTVVVRRFGTPVTLRVRRLPGATAEESELEIYFRDATNGSGSYPAGRFVILTPIGGERYVLDFNRARNPWCAYNTVFPCPPPWPGNAIAARVAAGERYGS